MLERLSVLRDPARLFTDYAVTQPSYIIFKRYPYILAKNGLTGQIEFWSKDASEVIESAKNALPRSGGLIYLKRGVYTLTNTINLDKFGVTLRGETWGWSDVYSTTLYLADGAKCDLIKITGSFTVVERLHLYGNADNNTLGHGILIEDCSDLKLKHLAIEYTREDMIEVVASSTDVWNLWVIGNILEYPKGAHIIAFKGTPNRIHRCFILNNYLRGGVDGIQLRDSVDHVLVEGNLIDRTGHHGVFLWKVKDILFSGNMIRDCGADSPNVYSGLVLSGESLADSARYVTIVGNQIYNRDTSNQKFGVAIVYGDYIFISTNSVYGNVTDQIYVGVGQNPNGLITNNFTV